MIFRCRPCKIVSHIPTFFLPSKMAKISSSRNFCKCQKCWKTCHIWRSWYLRCSFMIIRVFGGIINCLVSKYFMTLPHLIRPHVHKINYGFWHRLSRKRNCKIAPNIQENFKYKYLYCKIVLSEYFIYWMKYSDWLDFFIVQVLNSYSKVWWPWCQVSDYRLPWNPWLSKVYSLFYSVKLSFRKQYFNVCVHKKIYQKFVGSKYYW